MIQLDQFLKWADVLESGGQIRMLIEEDRIFVNGQPCSVKRKKLHRGDIVEVRGIGTYRLTGD